MLLLLIVTIAVHARITITGTVKDKASADISQIYNILLNGSEQQPEYIDHHRLHGPAH